MTKKNPSNVRLPLPLLADLRRIAGEHQLRGEKAPKFGDLLLMAWNGYKAVANPDNEKVALSSPLLEKVPPSLVGDEANVIKLTTAEIPWAQKFLYIIRHGDAETVEAIMRNVDRFSLLARLINREASASEELDRIADEIAADPKRRMEYLRDLDQRYPASGEATGQDEKPAPIKRARDSKKTGTGGKH